MAARRAHIVVAGDAPALAPVARPVGLDMGHGDAARTRLGIRADPFADRPTRDILAVVMTLVGIGLFALALVPRAGEVQGTVREAAPKTPMPSPPPPPTPSVMPSSELTLLP